MANHSDPESCVAHREVWSEALAGETSRPAIELRNHSIGNAHGVAMPEGHAEHDVNRKTCFDPAQSETLSMLGSLFTRKLGDLIGARAARHGRDRQGPKP